MEKKNTKIDLDYEHSNFEKVKIQPTKAFDISQVDNNLASLKKELSALSTEDLLYKLENEELDKESRDIINEIISSRK